MTASPDNQIGAYRLQSRIGQGGMGEVWLAEHTLLGRRAAIKLLQPGLSTNQEIVTRFFNEARAAASITDPGIVQIFDFGHHGSNAYIVMELLEGEPLDRRLSRIGRLPIGEALRIVRQVASALGAAHARNIIHRDLKPENIFLVRDPEVAGGERAKILDFGIAKLAGDPFALKTQTSALIGTPMYMSPEQCRGGGGGAIDQRTDIYSLGCVLFTLITGRTPFQAENVGDMIAKHIMEAPPLASQLVRGVTPAIDSLINRCLAKSPDARLGNGAELAQAIDAVTAAAPQPVATTLASAIHPAMSSGFAATMLPDPNAPGFAPTVAPLARGSSALVAQHPQLTPVGIIPLPAVTTLSRSVVALATPPRKASMRIGVLAGVGVVAALVSWLAVRGGSDSTTTTPAAAPPISAPTEKPAPAPAPAPAPTPAPAPVAGPVTPAHAPAPVAKPSRTATPAKPQRAPVTAPRPPVRDRLHGTVIGDDGIPQTR